ncbi:hypothetical protein PHYBLDRAFT_170399 [Phycomyces blakesleeanus NRRL 1555(-)]|uniref:Uncharacterized protein n=1 Tax=Phycomyces blakesleeanus (strain ATCC 8743b / DSM 1359 / FGSC 10004 / NBRC 33097 / NRRL 1555) TaxID=763407 RepID=A0A162N714_PHYB8|nr:hypothetical protein PHYBLDRAFT_170399 [Phycomyces blakesleeanus NRRL 1555(-)]OAD71738.1 hypothetical protein PHYBLDRAFT_170399 [Phycomyces blakesleeanus NRRL 1555(-)]|eukprot:XP_018289778.1 hypothetical protein PHYBLDRAFT_170399 [Phycomyces blakesleeanus NRRL 1555(-)]
MPRPKKRSTMAKKINRSASSGAFIKKIQLENEDYVDLEFDHEDDIVLDDRALQGMSEEVTSAAYTNQLLKWHECANKSLRRTYQKNSRTTEWRKRKADNDASNTQGSYRLTDKGFFIKVQKEAPIELKESIDSELENIQIDKIAVLKLAHEDVKKEIFPYTRAGPSSQSVDAFELCKLKSVECYLRYRISGAKTMEASEKASMETWLHKNTYRPAAIRKYAKEYVDFCSIALHQQGKHLRRHSLFSDEYIKSTICKWIQKQRPESRSLIEVKKYIDGEILPRKLGIPGNTSTNTIWKYLHEWGYVFRKNSKDIYYNGHEREDVIAYRQKWAKRMMVYKKKMATFSENEETVVLPVLRSNEIEHVLVTPDESTFYANDGKDTMWPIEDENPIRKKGPGMSLMISEFKCVCHGTMARGAWPSREVFRPGANRDGYWTSVDMLKQLKNNVIPLFELIHPGCKAVFSFDQSTNHKEYGQNALISSKMNLNDKEIEDDDPCSLQDTVFVWNGVEEVQSMYYEKDEWFAKKSGQWVQNKVKYVKGVRHILKERGLWLEKDPYNPIKKWRLDCKSKDASEDSKCCAHHFLASQPDFMSQKTALHEAVEDSGHIFELYPKFHCKCNWIERYWGAAKHEACLQCDYTYKSLDKNIHTFLNHAGKLPNICRYYNCLWCYIEAYSQEMNVKEANDVSLRFEC